MALDATARRRWCGALILVAALAMVIAGETLLKDRLGPLPTLAYWLLCLLLTLGAVVVAFLDARALQRQTRQEQRDLFEVTLKKIQTEAGSQPGKPNAR
jgi:hypothetical protein